MNHQEFLARKKSENSQAFKLNQSNDRELSDLKQSKAKSYAFREKITSQEENLENN